MEQRTNAQTTYPTHAAAYLKSRFTKVIIIIINTSCKEFYLNYIEIKDEKCFSKCERLAFWVTWIILWVTKTELCMGNLKPNGAYFPYCTCTIAMDKKGFTSSKSRFVHRFSRNLLFIEMVRHYVHDKQKKQQTTNVYQVKGLRRFKISFTFSIIEEFLPLRKLEKKLE